MKRLRTNRMARTVILPLCLFLTQALADTGKEASNALDPSMARNDMEIRVDHGFPGVTTLDHGLRAKMGTLPGEADPAQQLDSSQWRSEPFATHAAGAIAYFSDVRKIWDYTSSGASHYYNCFTSLIRFKEAWFISFRESTSHMGIGRARILRSSDGDKWVSVALLDRGDDDVRDPRLSLTSDGRLMLNGGARLARSVDGNTHQSLTWLSADGEVWSGPFASSGDLGRWRFDVMWHKGIGYSVGYNCWEKDNGGTLYQTRDGKTWVALVDDFSPSGKGTEASLVFGPDDTAYCLLRGAPLGRNLGIAKPPYKEWSWKGGVEFGGPKIIRLSDGRFLAGGRLIGVGPQRTSLVWIDPSQPAPENQANEFVTFPSGGDTGYPGIVEHDGFIWVTYYSREGKGKAKTLGLTVPGGSEDLASIYLARIKLARRPPASESLDPASLKGPRFDDHGDGTVTDHLTGLMWALAPVHHKKWDEAAKYCGELNLGGYDDWRLPTVRELRSLVDWTRTAPALPADHPFKNVMTQPHSPVWSSEVFRDWEGRETPYSWYMNLANGQVFINNRLKSAWPVRSPGNPSTGEKQ